MSEIFISHSSRNNDQAIRVRDWLVQEGWGPDQIFLDLDGLSVGNRWRERLNHIGATCEAVIVCLSDDWIRSPECVREFTHAEGRGKPIFPVQVARIAERIPSFIGDLQTLDAAPEKGADSLAKLSVGLLRARISPRHFPWPPPNDLARSPYRGLAPLDEQDAAVFFGRDVAITNGLDALRRMRQQATERILVVLGASGAGKSSFLRAGLLARLARDRPNFQVLPVLRPEQAALSGRRGLGASLGLGEATPVTGESLRKRVDQIHAAVAAASGGDTTASQPAARLQPPTLVLPIDQGEEFFAAEHAEGETALGLLCELLRHDDNTLAVVTIRSDSYERLQRALQEHGVVPLLFDLPAMSPGAFKDVIEGPGQLAAQKIHFEPALTERLIEDLEAAHALPLLAFTLDRLVRECGQDRLVELHEYIDKMGGLSGVIAGAVDTALVAASREPGLPTDRKALEALARQTFIPWLVQLDAGSRNPKRRRARWSDIPEDCRGLVHHLVAQRLLLLDGERTADGQAVFVEVTHEAVLRHWPLLGAWLEEEASDLGLLDNLQSATLDWLNNERSLDWLVHSGRRLASARSLFVKPLYASSLSKDTSDYLTACENNQKTDDRAEYDRRASLLKAELGEDIFEKLDQLQGMYDRVKSSTVVSLDAFSGGLVDELQQRKNKIVPQPMWHPLESLNVGTAGTRGDYAEIWKFPCCGTIHTQEAQPSQDRADGCKPKPIAG